MTALRQHAPWLLGVFAASVALFALFGGGVASHVDEAPYILAGRSYADWLDHTGDAVFRVSLSALKKQAQAIDPAFAINHEHPPIAKIVYGVCGRCFRFLGPLMAPRVGGLVFLLVLQFSLYFLIAPRWGRLAATAAALAVLAHPRLVGHAFACGLDLPVTAMSLLCTLCFVHGLENRRAAMLCGVVWGVAMATKNNAVFLIVPLGIWGLLVDRRRVIANLLSMALLGPLTFVAVWPWLWRHPFDRIVEYLNFHAQHIAEPTYCFGTVYAVHHWSYPLITFMVTTPLALLAFAAVGVGQAARRRPDPLAGLLLCLAVFALLLVTPPSVPTYNGDRMLLLCNAACCGLAGLGVAIIATRLRFSERTFGRRAAIVALLVMLLAVPGLAGVLTAHPFERSYYGAQVGFRAGAARLGFNPMDWSEVPPAVVTRLARDFPGGLNLDRNSGAATVIEGLKAIGFLGARQITFSEHAEYWLLEANFAYSGFARYWLLYYDFDQEYKHIQELGGHSPRMLSLYKRRSSGGS